MSSDPIRTALERLVRAIDECDPGIDGHAIAAARAALAVAAVAEVGELARLLRLDAELERGDGITKAAERLDRAADLLEQLAAAAPAAVPDGPAVPESREPASVAPEASGPRLLTPADRLVLAVCPRREPMEPCPRICAYCRDRSTAVARELAQILRERHGGSSQVADWLDGVGCHD